MTPGRQRRGAEVVYNHGQVRLVGSEFLENFVSNYLEWHLNRAYGSRLRGREPAKGLPCKQFV